MFNCISIQNHDYFSADEAKKDLNRKEHLFLLRFKKMERVDSTITTPSYWFVVCRDDNGRMYNFTMEQQHLYFSFDDAKKEIISDKVKKVFILDFEKISRRTYDQNQN